MQEQKKIRSISAKEKFIEAAIEHGRYTLSGHSSACNRAHDRVIKAIKELRRLPDQGEEILIELSSHTNDSVKAWASTYLLPLHEDKAIEALEAVAYNSGLIAFGATIVLQEWRAGRLKLLC